VRRHYAQKRFSLQPKICQLQQKAAGSDKTSAQTVNPR